MNLGILACVIAGIVAVVQNAVMSAMIGRGLNFGTALLFNSCVGLVLLVAIELARVGPTFFNQAMMRFEYWFVFAGMLGTAFVFSVLFGFRTIGASTTIAIVFATQLMAALLLDISGWLPMAFALSGRKALGILLTLFGVFCFPKLSD
jgi:bacterial/archaeal transporter family-2 protein